jgi:hypothetical protein
MAPDIIDVHAHVVFETLNGTAGVHGPEAGVDRDWLALFSHWQIHDDTDFLSGHGLH